jgi:hypothetical protein
MLFVIFFLCTYIPGIVSLKLGKKTNTGKTISELTINREQNLIPLCAVLDDKGYTDVVVVESANAKVITCILLLISFQQVIN